MVTTHLDKTTSTECSDVLTEGLPDVGACWSVDMLFSCLLTALAAIPAGIERLCAEQRRLGYTMDPAPPVHSHACCPGPVPPTMVRSSHCVIVLQTIPCSKRALHMPEWKGIKHSLNS